MNQLKIFRLQPRINSEGSGAANYCAATFDADAVERDLIFEDVVVAVTVKVAALLTI
jgi:hypothetical protein